ncbi:prephenate/arogenate dehydrogenase family protein [Methylovirgula sp. 4M-Z18]|uniref:prephenate/arogenate dehydrogenase family protein n=1 Tax=Methylovirgula sp. 4M-Z18 TaxID=2293567 RepID=UPI000E2E4ABE|nr:prephenate/arogenate dehydrogenase family protein [Methylovirgula sp. 4M-Z18]RFB79274.1 prephenate/arogenate dehydrogenase family protein [Methylovirgula sp. 4M-Z18]
MPDGLGEKLGTPLVERVALIGLGLIGSSLARVIRRKGIANTIVAADGSDAVCARVRDLAIADEVTTSLKDAVRDADLVILCVPVGASGPVAEAIGPHLKKNAILSDVGSVKGAVVAAVQPHLRPDVHFLPAHPVAGTEYSGPDAGFATLFLNRWCIITPPNGEPDAGALATLTNVWRAAGSNVEVMAPAHHDLVLAITSHVPHLIAYNIVGTADDLEQVTESEVIKFSAGGFRDFTRIAASDPTMWRDVFLHNKDAVLEVLGRFNEDLAILQRMIRWGDGQSLFDFFTRTRAIRRGIIAAGQETAAPDFGRRGSGE